MRGILLKGFFRCRALSTVPNVWVRKRRSSFPLPQLKRRKLLAPGLEFDRDGGGDEGDSDEEESDEEESDEEESEVEEKEEEEVLEEEGLGEEDVGSEESAGGSEELPEFLGKPNKGVGVEVDVPSAAQRREKPSLYPSVVYEGNVAIVKLGVGQMVTLDGCAMVQVVEGQASMLGYSLPRGSDILVCSSSKLGEIITVEAGLVSEDGGSGGAEMTDVNMEVGSEDTSSLRDILGCQLRFASHSVGKDVVSERSLSFKLEFVGSLGERIQDQGSYDIDESESDNDELELDSEASYSDSENGDERDDQIEVPLEDVESAATPDIVKKRKGRERNSPSTKRQRVAEPVDSFPSATSIPRDWKEAVETITHGSSIPIIAICGAKNVGKSTFARFLVNSLLNRYKEVAYLDTDVGQPEFTAPGCVSLHILDTPVVGPPAMHLRTPDRCFFYGDVSPKSNPMMYVEHVAELFSYFRQKHSVNSTLIVPLVINTHGWVKGIGYDVIVDILKATSPTHVVQLLANSKKKNLPRDKFWDETSSAVTIHMESAVENLPVSRSARSAHHLRAARLLGYFQKCFGENSAPFPYREAKLFAQTAMSLVRDIPYKVPISALKIKHLHSEVPPSESLRSFNAAIVGLGVTCNDKYREDNDDGSGSSFPLCLGLGIVKAVDVAKGVVYVTTPVPLEQLQHVDILLQGRVEIPLPLLTARGYRCPYICEKSQLVEGVGAGAMRTTKKQSTKKVL
ncbi:hypothetical protein KC19_1G309000 [Ceratodon purpureus]|uniref:Uncharacterized protein n=2 Tax=Ceratodon purpureus TaxID=3225 RepID=A0A8T0JCV7_CERPU|nr:hypothetical protein KC19_1G309000 [Ceratodon purpureus]